MLAGSEGHGGNSKFVVLGDIAEDANGNLWLANAFAEKSMEVAYKLNDKITIAEVYKIKGIIQRNKNNFDVAENYLLTSLRLNSETGNKLNYAETSYELGILFKLSNDNKKSKKYFTNALEYYKMIEAEEEIKEIEKLIKK
ncbi:MAG: hypothetical protein IH819_06365 [Bacteroidetes bacterium]|nr:hypothetical protein [Bacteroidota bacterium]